MNCVILLILILLSLLGCYHVVQNLFRFLPGTLSELIPALQRIDAQELGDLLDEVKQENLLVGSAADQWPNRVRLFAEYLRRMGHNALLILFWAYAEQERHGRMAILESEREHGLRMIVETALEFRLYSLLTVAKLLWWLLQYTIGSRPTGNLPAVSRLGKIDGIDTYRRLTDAVYLLSLSGGSDIAQRLIAALWHR